MTINEFPGEVLRGDKNKVSLTPDQTDWLRHAVKYISNERIMDKMHISLGTLYIVMRDNGIKRTDADKSRILRYTYVHKSKQKLEARYESMRGHMPSQQCLDALRKKREEGLIVHYMKQLKDKNPSKYKRIVKSMAEKRKSLRRNERLRVEYGLEPKTGIHTPSHNYTLKQKNIRFNMKRRGYILGDMRESFGERYVIYYDDDTERATRAELNACNAGFKILRLAE